MSDNNETKDPPMWENGVGKGVEGVENGVHLEELDNIPDDSDEKGHTFRKRRLSLTNLRQIDSDDHQADIVATKLESCATITREKQGAGLLKSDDSDFTEEKAHSFRKRRLSLTQNRSDGEDEDGSPKRLRRNSEASADTIDSNSNHLKSRTSHAIELLSQPPPSPRGSSNKLYQQAAPPQKTPLKEAIGSSISPPKWKKRHTRHVDEKSLPFPKDVVGVFSAHGVEPIYDSDYLVESDDPEDEQDDEWVIGSRLPSGALSGKTLPNGNGPEQSERPTMAAKINQDRGGVAFPYGNCAKTALFGVYDGHGMGGELVSQYALFEVQRLLERHKDFTSNIEKAFKETFIKVDAAMTEENLIEPLYAGTTACVALLRENKLILANAGDSRAVLARKISKDNWEAIDLTRDQNPDLAEEQERIEEMGGFVSPPPEPGLSARVWLDPNFTQIGLAMARSIGDHAVKPIGVIAEPVVTFHDLRPDDDFVILATDGVWEFIKSAEAVRVVTENMHKGATKACRALIEAAAARWHEEEGEYRDDITAIIVRLNHLWDSGKLEEGIHADKNFDVKAP